MRVDGSSTLSGLIGALAAERAPDPAPAATAADETPEALDRVSIGRRHRGAEVYHRLYNRAQFDRTDTDGDRRLSPEELKAREKWADGYGLGIAERRVKHADADKDGNVSLEEAKRQKRWEIKHRKKLYRENEDELRELKRSRDRCGCEEPKPAEVEKKCKPCPEPLSADYDRNGKLDIFDFLAFLNGYAAKDKLADYNRDGELDRRDFEVFRKVFQRQRGD